MVLTIREDSPLFEAIGGQSLSYAEFWFVFHAFEAGRVSDLTTAQRLTALHLIDSLSEVARAAGR
jgi:hypothetical protein